MNSFDDILKKFPSEINVSVMLVSESYVLLYYVKKVYMLFINKICLNQNVVNSNLVEGRTKIMSYKNLALIMLG